MRAAKRRAREMVDDAMVFYSDLRAGKRIRKRFLGPAKRNVLIKTHVSVQTLLADLDHGQAYDYALKCCTSGKEGFFALKTNADVTAAEALVLYRKKDSIEKLFHSFKNEIEVKPVRCWKKERIIGVLLIGFIIQLFVSLLRHAAEITRHTCTNFIKKSLRNLTETVIMRDNREKRRVYSNFDTMNVEILRKCGVIT
jgi:transposase